MEKGAKIGPSLVTAEEGGKQVWRCLYCESTICPFEEDWGKHLLVVEDMAVEYFRRMNIRVLERESPNIIVRHYFCPHCKASMRMEAFPEGYQYPEDVIRLSV